MHQVAGSIFVMGDADCGQLGLGEDITEKLRPGPLRLEGEKKVGPAMEGLPSPALPWANLPAWEPSRIPSSPDPLRQCIPNFFLGAQYPLPPPLEADNCGAGELV